MIEKQIKTWTIQNLSAQSTARAPTYTSGHILNGKGELILGKDLKPLEKQFKEGPYIKVKQNQNNVDKLKEFGEKGIDIKLKGLKNRIKVIVDDPP